MMPKSGRTITTNLINKYFKYMRPSLEELKKLTKEELSKFRQECIVMSRTVGWITPIKNWNPGKVSEWLSRKFYKQ